MRYGSVEVKPNGPRGDLMVIKSHGYHVYKKL